MLEVKRHRNIFVSLFQTFNGPDCLRLRLRSVVPADGKQLNPIFGAMIIPQEHVDFFIVYFLWDEVLEFLICLQEHSTPLIVERNGSLRLTNS